MVGRCIQRAVGIFFPTEVAAVRRTNTRLQWLFLLSARLLCSKTRVVAYCASSSGGFRKGGICGEGGGSMKGCGSISEMDERVYHVKVMGEKLIFALAYECLETVWGRKGGGGEVVVDTACAVKKHVLHSDPPRMTNIRSRIETEPRQAMSPFLFPAFLGSHHLAVPGGRG